MNQTTTNELKSEKLKLGKVFLIIWLVAIVAFFSFAAVKYAGYKEIQDAGLVCAALASSEYDSPDREEVIHDLYMDMTRTSYLGQNWNEYSGAIRDAMEDALEDAVDLLTRRIVKNRKRLDDKFSRPALEAVYEEPADEEPYNVIREKHFHVKPSSVEEAILEMNLLGHSFFMFRDFESDEINVVYRRADGSYGLLIPER